MTGDFHRGDDLPFYKSPFRAVLYAYLLERQKSHWHLRADGFLRLMRQRSRCDIFFSRSICRGGLAALIGVTGKPYPSCLSCHSHPIRPCGHLPLEGKAAIREYHLLKKAAKPPREPRTLNPEPNESKVKRGCEEMRIHFFTAPLCLKDPTGLSLFLQSPSQLQALISLPWLLSLPGRCLAAP